ncbi:MAG: threonine synthase [Actinomycetota bacterium]
MATSGVPLSRLSHLQCSRCDREHPAGVVQQRCGCGGALLARYRLEDLSLDALRARPAGAWRYRELLPVQGDPVSLGEPETPLLFLGRLSEEWGVETWMKDDGPLPGGTFKARGACVGLSRAVELGITRVVMPTAGNAGGTWSLYAARAGIGITVVMAESTPPANQAEVRVAGGELVLVPGSIADAGRRAAEIAGATGAFLATTFSEPYRLEGKKSAWLELFDRMGETRASPGAPPMAFPRTIVLPVGGGVAAVAAAKAAAEVAALGWAAGNPPRLVGIQAAACAPIVRAYEAGDHEALPWEDDPRTIAAGLRVPAPAEGAMVLECVRATGGAMHAVAEDEIRGAMVRLASTEGVFACPEGATTVAAMDRLARAGLEGPVVLYNTGAGAKYVDVLHG